jgi:hypothetical protein
VPALRRPHPDASGGTRRNKLEIVELWRCASCKRTFTPGPAALHKKTYPLHMILSALADMPAPTNDSAPTASAEAV